MKESRGQTVGNREWRRRQRKFDGPQKDEPLRSQHRRILAWVVGGVFLLALGFAFDRALDQRSHPRIDANNADQVELGRRIYSDACANCHGVVLQGQPNWRTRLATGALPAPPLDATGPSWQRRDSDLFAIIKRGPSVYGHDRPVDMPAFAGRLTDQEIAASLAFIEHSWPKEVRRRHEFLDLAFWTREGAF